MATDRDQAKALYDDLCGPSGNLSQDDSDFVSSLFAKSLERLDKPAKVKGKAAQGELV
jgi:hypothetical protein